ncbi:MAG: hypothetical protein IPI35_36120 [Deltaproteobacteria bacterium]|nr:hypothetical protein [Deltaproteobacteria bacterium]
MSLFWLVHPTRARSASVSPLQNLVFVPARQAYSHSGSKGSRAPTHSANITEANQLTL